MYLNRPLPAAVQVTGVVIFNLADRVGESDRRLTFDSDHRFGFGHLDASSGELIEPEVLSVFTGGAVYHAEAVRMSRLAPGDEEMASTDARLGLAFFRPPLDEKPIEAGIVTAVVHGFVNPSVAGPSRPFVVETLVSPPIVFPGDAPIVEMDPGEVHRAYVRYVGAGAVAIGGLLSLLKSLPTIISSLRRAAVALFGGGGRDETDRDLPLIVVLIGVAGIAATMWKVPFIKTGWIGAVLVCLFGFLFVTVSSRLVGQVGSSSNPISGMTIATLLGTALVFLYLGNTGDEGKITALSVGALVCIAIAIAGDCSQDLKTGFLVKATPWKQQIGEILGVAVASLCVAGVLFILDKGYGLTEDRPNALAAPQANLMAMLVNGVFDRNLPWLFIFIGIASGLIVEFLGIDCLPFAVGLYLPLELSTPIMVGGLVRLCVDWLRRSSSSNGGHNPGILAASGLVAGEALVGVGLGGVTALLAWAWPRHDLTCDQLAPWFLRFIDVDLRYGLDARLFDVLPLVPFALLVLWLFATAMSTTAYGGPATGTPHSSVPPPVPSRPPGQPPSSPSRPPPVQLPPQPRQGPTGRVS